MKTKIHLSSISLLSAMAMTMAGFQATAHEEDVAKPQKKVIYQAALPGVAGMEMTVAHVAVPAGFVGGKHLHPGPVFVYVLEGVLTVELEVKPKPSAKGNSTPRISMLRWSARI